ncbi:MAG TPA: substrate-binding domain-containing protein [Thermoanaerobaculia bacterium]|nr:substrate-binding domain-containing protein [Thermoanaerobaculia bacterium]
MSEEDMRTLKTRATSRTMVLARAVAVCALLVASSCGTRSPAGRDAGKAAHHPLTVGAIIYGDYIWSEGARAGMRKAAAAQGVKLLFRKHYHDVADEARLLRELTELRVDAVVISVQDPDASVPAIRATREAGIPVLCIGSCLNEEDTARYNLAYYESDPTLVGYRTGTYLAQWAAEHVPGPVRIGILNCDRIAAARSAGFRAALADAGLRWEEIADREGYIAAPAVPVAKGILAEYPDIQVLWAANEGGTEAAVTAVREMGRQGRVFVFGTDYGPTLSAMLSDLDGVLQAVTAQTPEQIGEQSLLDALKLARGETLSIRHSVFGTIFYSRQPAGASPSPGTEVGR